MCYARIEGVCVKLKSHPIGSMMVLRKVHEYDDSAES
jgi:hypothetical protein